MLVEWLLVHSKDPQKLNLFPFWFTNNYGDCDAQHVVIVCYSETTLLLWGRVKVCIHCILPRPHWSWGMLLFIWKRSWKRCRWCCLCFVLMCMQITDNLHAYSHLPLIFHNFSLFVMFVSGLYGHAILLKYVMQWLLKQHLFYSYSSWL